LTTVSSQAGLRHNGSPTKMRDETLAISPSMLGSSVTSCQSRMTKVNRGHFWKSPFGSGLTYLVKLTTYLPGPQTLHLTEEA
jgi:hypothetical protein